MYYKYTYHRFVIPISSGGRILGRGVLIPEFGYDEIKRQEVPLSALVGARLVNNDPMDLTSLWFLADANLRQRRVDVAAQIYGLIVPSRPND